MKRSSFFLLSVYFISICARPFPFPILHCKHSVTGAWTIQCGLGAHDCIAGIATGAVLCLGAGWTQWRPPDSKGTHLPNIAGSCSKEIR